MPNAWLFAPLLLPALASLLDTIGRDDDAELVRRVEFLLGELVRGPEERQAAARAELAELTRELGLRVRQAYGAYPNIAEGAERLTRELERLLSPNVAATTPPPN